MQFWLLSLLFNIVEVSTIKRELSIRKMLVYPGASHCDPLGLLNRNLVPFKGSPHDSFTLSLTLWDCLIEIWSLSRDCLTRGRNETPM
jgi:hypothetical protein